MFLLILLVACTATAQVLDKPYYNLEDADDLFKEYLLKHGKAYGPEEYLTRLDHFKESLKEINRRNAEHPLTRYGITHFADWTAEEKLGYTGGFDETLEGLTTKVEYPPEAITAPEQWDWRDHGAVVPDVKDQPKGCYSGHILAATGSIEGQYALKYKKCLALSAQQSLDCMEPYYKYDNCKSGNIHQVMKHYMGYGEFSKYITLESEYPYKGRQGSCLDRNNMTRVTNITGIKMISADEESLKQILYETGPLATILLAGDLPFYEGGILVPDVCSITNVLQPRWNVLIVGYGIDNRTDTKYWIVKSFHGPGWGEKGYFRLLRGVEACRLGVLYTVTCTIW